MANTILSSISRAFYISGQNLGVVTQTCMLLDEVTDMTVVTPTDPDCIYLLAYDYAVTVAHTLRFKSGSSIIKSLAFDGATSFVSGYINTGLLFTATAQPLVLSIDVPTYFTTFTTTGHELAAAFLRRGV
jgi:hypothetical protein